MEQETINKGIKFICEINKWFDKLNGNTYHSVNITDTETNKLIFSSGLTYGYGEAYRQTAKEGLISLGLFKKEDMYNHELIRQIFHFSVNENALKKDLKKIEIEKDNKPKVILSIPYETILNKDKLNEIVKELNIYELENLKADGYTNECFFKDDILTKEYTYTLKEKQKYYYIDKGTSGKFMIDKLTGNIFGIKAYGQINIAHSRGNIKTENLNIKQLARL